MPEKSTITGVRRARCAGKSPSMQAAEFIREEIHHVREGKHGARSTKQAIAIALSKARRAGVLLPAPKRRSERVREQARRDLEKGKHPREPSRRRSRAVHRALEREGSAAATPAALSHQARSSAAKRTAKARSLSAEKAARTKGPRRRREAARKAARTRAGNRSRRA